jgi:hypothetical protein
MAIAFLFSKEIRQELFERRETLKMKTLGILIPNQVAAAGAFMLQNWAIALVPLSSLAFINALEGTRYVFLLILAVFFSLTQPLWAERTGLKEEVSRKIILQKIIALLLISGGLILLAFNQ